MTDNGKAARTYSEICDAWRKRGDEIELLKAQNEALEGELDSLRKVLSALARVIGITQIEKELAERSFSRTSLLFLQESRKVAHMRDERDASLTLAADSLTKKTSKVRRK